MTKSERLREQVGETLTPEQLTYQMTRLNAAFGAPRDRSEDMTRMMAREWYRALKGFGHKTVASAVTKLIATSKFWPTISEVHAICDTDEHGWKDALGLLPRQGGLADYTGRGEPQPKIAPLSAAELAAKKAADVLRMKAAYGDAFKEKTWIDRMDEWAPASQAMEVSDALRNSCAAKRARGEKTCEPNCSRKPIGCAFQRRQDEEAA